MVDRARGCVVLSRLSGRPMLWLLVLVISFAGQSCSPDMAPGRGAKEQELRQNLFKLRQGISQYTLDRKKSPQTLDELVTAGYVKSIPKDPFTNQANWVLEHEDAGSAGDKQSPGITDLHSASGLRALDGSAYSSW